MFKRQAVTDSSKTKIYIRGLPGRATQDEVQEFFASCGEIKNVELPLQSDGRSSGTAVIEFGDEDASAAALEMNGSDFGGRWLHSKYCLCDTCCIIFIFC